MTPELIAGPSPAAEPEEKPKIVCLCGSTRFWKTFQEKNLELTKEGCIVLSIGAATASDTEHLLQGVITAEDKARFDELHLRKIDLADEVLVLNVGGYIGESTAKEIDYAKRKGKLVFFLEDPAPAAEPSSKENKMIVTKEMVDRFLTWPLPFSVCADPCTTKQQDGRIGTNLLSAIEAKAMLEHVLTAPAAEQVARAAPFIAGDLTMAKALKDGAKRNAKIGDVLIEAEIEAAAKLLLLFSDASATHNEAVLKRVAERLIAATRERGGR